VSYREDLLKGYETGNFLETVRACSRTDHTDCDTLALELAVLHNEGFIDVVDAFKLLENNSSNGSSFFSTRHIFEKTLPNLNASLPSVMQCVLQLFRRADQDGAAGIVIESFIEFCAKKTSRPREALTGIEANFDQFLELLPAVLIAGSRIDNSLYLAETIRFCGNDNIEIKSSAVFSLGKLDWPEGIAVPDSALAVLELIAAVETDDRILANTIDSAFTLLQRDKSLESRVVALILTALSKGDEYALYAIFKLFGFRTGELPVSLLDALSTHLVRVKPAHKGTLDKIDYGVSHLIKKGDFEKAVQFLEDLLLTHPNELSMGVFDSAAREILNNKALLNKMLTRWFLRGDRALCNAIHVIVGTHHDKDLPLEIDTAELKRADLVCIFFVARKAIGYLFMQPISVASILISLMRLTTDDEVLTGLGTMLFDPILLNFTGKARDYVIQQSEIESGKVKQAIDNALTTVDDYLEDLRSVGNLAALHPGEAQREAYSRHFSRLMAESYKAAEAQSIFRDLFSKSVLLYGRKSINYVYGPDGQSRRMEIPLQSHGIEIEAPRMENLDPFGLDYMLRVFENERFRA
jgi:hypothetical protein